MAERKFAKEDNAAIAALIDEGHKIQEDYTDLLERRDINREGLRALIAAGAASKNQCKMIDELYKPRQSKSKTTTDEGQAAQAA